VALRGDMGSVSSVGIPRANQSQHTVTAQSQHSHSAVTARSQHSTGTGLRSSVRIARANQHPEPWSLIRKCHTACAGRVRGACGARAGRVRGVCGAAWLRRMRGNWSKSSPSPEHRLQLPEFTGRAQLVLIDRKILGVDCSRVATWLVGPRGVSWWWGWWLVGWLVVGSWRLEVGCG